jgi:hypothetical protein
MPAGYAQEHALAIHAVQLDRISTITTYTAENAIHTYIPMYTAAPSHFTLLTSSCCPSAVLLLLAGTAALCPGARLLRQEPSTYTTTKGQTPKGFFAVADKAEAGAAAGFKGVRYAAGGCCATYHRMIRCKREPQYLRPVPASTHSACNVVFRVVC